MKTAHVPSSTTGSVLVELVVSIALAAVTMAGVVQVMALHNRVYVEQDLGVSMQQNLRMASDIVTDTMRTSGYGVPSTNVSTWIPWVASFTANPLIIQGTTDTLTVAGCFREPVAHLSARAAVGSTVLSVASDVSGSSVNTLLDTGTKRLILIGESEAAHVVDAGASSITIDINPTLTGNQGLPRPYPAGTPICRVDVRRFQITTDTTTGLSTLTLDENDGSGARALAEGISDLQIDPIPGTKRYQVAVAARTEKTLPTTGNYVTRTLRSIVTLKN